MSIPLTRLTRADLDPETLEALFNDLSTQVEIDTVLIKGDTTTRAAVGGLAEARKALADGARAIQIRYRWQGEGWFDTLMRTAGGIRLVRAPLAMPPEVS